MRFGSLETRNNVLKFHKLVHKENDEEITIYISPDRTKKQQKEHKDLVLEMKKKRVNGENYGIRNGKVVLIQPFRRNPQLYFQ